MTNTTDRPSAAAVIDELLDDLDAEQFVDTLWVDAEFSAIIAANFDTEPPEPPAAPTGLPHRWQPSLGRPYLGPRLRLTGLVIPGEQHRRQRSPPP